MPFLCPSRDPTLVGSLPAAPVRSGLKTFVLKLEAEGCLTRFAVLFGEYKLVFSLWFTAVPMAFFHGLDGFHWGPK